MTDIARLLFLLALPVALSFIAAAPAQAAQQTLLNVRYDVSREFYKDYNLAFAAHWNKTTGEDVTLNQSHGGGSRQARSVADGLEGKDSPKVDTFSVDMVLDGWTPAQKDHFNNGALYDQVIAAAKSR